MDPTQEQQAPAEAPHVSYTIPSTAAQHLPDPIYAHHLPAPVPPSLQRPSSSSSRSQSKKLKYQTPLPPLPEKVDFTNLPDTALRKLKQKYRIKFKPSPSTPAHPSLLREELVDIIHRQFQMQEINERESVAYFIYYTRNLGNPTVLGERRWLMHLIDKALKLPMR